MPTEQFTLGVKVEWKKIAGFHQHGAIGLSRKQYKIDCVEY